MSSRAVVLLSGGLDSTTVCAIAKAEKREIYALTIDYHQRNHWEINAAREIANRFQVAEHIIFPLDLSLFGGSSLTDDNIPVDKTKSLQEIGEQIPSSYVPARNTIFLSLALGFAETRAASEIWLGVNNVDYSGYPDCRPSYIQAYQNLAKLATKAGVEGKEMTIMTPLLNLNKGQIIRRGLELGVDYSITRTCYDLDDQGRACGRCESCLLRKEGFRQANALDPTVYR
ncbi:MAG: 7-cyano-7-deazaguanine synthase QueC [Planctomycetia bacterium]|nr:7-cyano-7-deazaguanine synthase QueC [Planctomycetia bacterium]